MPSVNDRFILASDFELRGDQVQAVPELVDGLTRGAAIAFYTVTSIGPVLLIVVAVAGLAFGRDAAQSALIGQLSELMGREAGGFFQTVLANAQSKTAGALSAAAGVITLIVTASEDHLAKIEALVKQLRAEILDVSFFRQILDHQIVLRCVAR